MQEWREKKAGEVKKLWTSVTFLDRMMTAEEGQGGIDKCMKDGWIQCHTVTSQRWLTWNLVFISHLLNTSSTGLLAVFLEEGCGPLPRRQRPAYFWFPCCSCSGRVAELGHSRLHVAAAAAAASWPGAVRGFWLRSRASTSPAALCHCLANKNPILSIMQQWIWHFQVNIYLSHSDK